MSAGKYQIDDAEQGSDFIRQITWEEDSVGVDLTAYDIRMQVRNGYRGALVLEMTTANGRITKTDAVNGEFQIEVTGEDMQDIPAGSFVYDIEMVNTAVSPNTITRFLQGAFIISPEVTI